MKKTLAWVAGGLLGAVTAVGFIPISFGSAHLRAALKDQFALAAGLDASSNERVTVAVLPYPRVTYSNVRIGHPEDSFTLVTERLTTELSLRALAMGRLEFAALRLVRPDISIDASAERPEHASVIRRAMNAPSSSEESRAADRVRLGSLRIVDGVIRARAKNNSSILIERINATVDWPNLGASASLTGRGVWRGERFNLDVLLARPAEVLRGERSPFIGKLTSKLIEVAIDGTLAGGVRWMIDARLASNSERFTQLLSLAGVSPPIPGRLARFGLSGQLRALSHTATLSDVRLTLDANAFEGSLTVQAGEKRPKISGTLATRVYELRTSEAGLPAMQRDRQWSKDGFAIGRLDLLDADLRLSATRLNIGRLAIADAGFVIALDDGLLEITTASAEAYGGAFRGRWRFNSRVATPELEATGTVRNVNIGALMRALGRPGIGAGVAAGEYTLQTSGSSVHAMMQNASGALKASIRNLDIVGVDLERALRRTERRPLSIPAELRTGQTSFASAEIDGKIDTGLFRLARAIATGPGVEASAAGEISLPDRTLRVEVAAQQPRPARSAGDGKEAPALVLDIEGSWNAPALSLDPESLIRRSEAAAPLLRRAQPAATEPLER
jgi:AsmA protein